MDPLDFLGTFPVRMPGEPSRERSTAENIVGAVGLGVAPVIDFLIVLFAGLYEHPTVALLLLPAAFTFGTFLLGKRLQVSTAWTVTASLGCAISCFLAGGIAFLMGVFFSFFSAF